nr:MAG TPA_asm: DOR family protein [Caudoviricetes sp.]
MLIKNPSMSVMRALFVQIICVCPCVQFYA